MKKFMAKCKRKCREFCNWIWEQCKDLKTLFILGIVCLVMFSPTIVCGILGFLFSWEWALGVAGAYWAFWLLPGSPFFVIAVTVTLSIKRLLQVIFGKKKEKEEVTKGAESTEKTEGTDNTAETEPEPIIIEADEVDMYTDEVNNAEGEKSENE